MFTDAKTALDFIFAGKARVTLTSKVSGNSFTFKIDAPKDRATGETDRSILFVKVLNGPDNSWDGDWMFIGFIARRQEGPPRRAIFSRSGLDPAPARCRAYTGGA
jgi:hypothetical protein